MEENKEALDSNIEKEKPAASSTGMYKVESVILLESSFVRETMNTENKNITNEIHISPQAYDGSGENKFAVAVTVEYIGKQGEAVICTAKIKMMGLFEKAGEPAVTEDNFKKINAPAIIYPFIREHLHNTCLKAGIADVLLPTVNFKL